MVAPILFPFFHDSAIVSSLLMQSHLEKGDIIFHTFPDAETCVRVNTTVKNRAVILLADLTKPNDKLLPLIFSAETLRAQGATFIGLIAPYLPYMRQDKSFHAGEGITSRYFASLLSRYVDWLITVDPHLHRYHSLNEIYTIPTSVVHATEPIARWIKQHVEKPLIIGPDEESQQWASHIAMQVDAPWTVLKKIRHDDRQVEVTLLDPTILQNRIPVLVDDIIATGKTMIETVKQLHTIRAAAPICVGVHGLFVENAYEELLAAGALQVVTCNTVPHPSNGIDLSEVLAEALLSLRAE